MIGNPRLRHGLCWLARCLLVPLLLASGCTRAHYRRKADAEVYKTVDCFDRDPRWNLDDYSIRPNPASRMFDPDNPDQPPLPPDDPAAHRLMECPDCKRGWPHWHRNGDTLDVQNPRWRAYLPYNEQGKLCLDREGVVALAFLHSREYQDALEEVYLSALDVTFQRYRFDTHFFARHSTTFTAEGPFYDGNNGTATNTLAVNQPEATVIGVPQPNGTTLRISSSLSPTSPKSLEADKFMATGGTLVVGLANQLVWQFAGPDQYATTSLLDFSLVQPLLRNGGRAVALENVTQAERSLLENVRQMARFRQAFWVNLMNGRPTPTGTGPVRGISAVAVTVSSTAVAGTSAPPANGLLGLLAEEQSIRNQRANVSAMRDAVSQLETTYTAGRIDRFQVNLTRQALINNQSSLLANEKSHVDHLDAYKIQLGLPPSLNVQFSDRLLSRFNMIDPELTAVSESLDGLLDKIRDLALPGDQAQLVQWLGELRVVSQGARAQIGVVRQDMERLDEAAPQRRADLARLSLRDEPRRGDVEQSTIDLEAFNTRLETIHKDCETAIATLDAALKAIEQCDVQAATPAERRRRREQLELLAFRLALRLSDLSLVQARARAEAITLVPIELDPGEALEIARANRLDWMNARAFVVNFWRQIQIRANALRSDLNVSLSGDLGTVGNDPLRFRSTTGRLRAGVEFDAPLTRLAERNLYREALLDYQRARRDYYAFEDRVSQSLRTTLGSLRLDQLNFEVRRAALILAVIQVEITRLRITRPPKPGEATVLGATTASDLVNSLSTLLNAQNGILSVWIDYESQRMNLDLELGTFQFNDRSMWADPGPIESGTLPTASREELPPPAPEPPAEDNHK